MEPLYDALEPEQASDVAQLARLMYETREHRRQILEEYHSNDADELIARVRALAAAGEAEHPAYEHYLAVRVLDDTRSAARALMAARLKDEGSQIDPPPSLHLLLNEALETHLETQGRDLLGAPHVLRQDALLLTLRNGVVLTVQYAAPAAYSLRWKTPAAAELGIDTAPGHRGLHTGPQHLHLADGRVVDDPLTRPDLPPWQNLRAVIDALLEDPLLARISRAP